MTSIRYNARRESLRVGVSPIKLFLVTVLSVPALLAACWFATQVYLGEIDVSDSRRGAIFMWMVPVIIPMSLILAAQLLFNLPSFPPAVLARRGEFLARDFMGEARIPAEEVAAVGVERVGSMPHIRFVHHAEEDRGDAVTAEHAPGGDLWRFKAHHLKQGAPRTEEAVEALSRFLEPRRMDREEALQRYMRRQRAKGRRFLGWRLAHGVGFGIGLLLLHADWDRLPLPF